MIGNRHVSGSLTTSLCSVPTPSSGLVRLRAMAAHRSVSWPEHVWVARLAHVPDAFLHVMHRHPLPYRCNLCPPFATPLCTTVVRLPVWG